MPALQPRSSELASGAYNLSWNGLPEATGYYAWAMGAKDMGRGQANEMVWWTSASTQQFGGPMSEWIAPAAVARLIQAGTVMPPNQTTCAVPAEVKQAGGAMLMTQLFAYGPQANFSYPERPANAGRNWQPEWIARVRFRSNTMLMHGMPGMGDFEDGDTADESAEAPQQTLPRCRGGLRGMAERAAGLCQ